MMSHQEKAAKPNPHKDLLERAAATSLNSARIIARSIALVMRSIEIAQAVADACARAEVSRTRTLRAQVPLNRPSAEQPAATRLDPARVLPLTPSRLLELAGEFRSLADSAATPESQAAFQDLMFRYTALASGFDDERIGSRMVH
jgi:hypothetical protein